MTADDVIAAAARVLKPYRTKTGRLFGDVGAAILSEKGKLYTGTCVDTPNWGLCAERSAMATMITNGEYKIQKVLRSGEMSATKNYTCFRVASVGNS